MELTVMTLWSAACGGDESMWWICRCRITYGSSVSGATR